MHGSIGSQAAEHKSLTACRQPWRADRGSTCTPPIRPWARAAARAAANSLERCERWGGQRTPLLGVEALLVHPQILQVAENTICVRLQCLYGPCSIKHRTYSGTRHHALPSQHQGRGMKFMS